MASHTKVLVRRMSQTKKWEPLARVGILGVPFEKGQKKYGVSVAPAALRCAGLVEQLRQIEGLDVKDFGDVDTPKSPPSARVDNMEHLEQVSACAQALSVRVAEVLRDDRVVITIGGDHSIGVAMYKRMLVDNIEHLEQVSACAQALSTRVAEVLRDGRVVVTIGGDHSIGVGSVDGHYKVNEDMILIWVDAHADINTNETSDSGSVHGMPVALLCRELSDYWPYLPTMDWQVPRFSIKNLGYIGLRSVDSYERLAIEKYNIPTFAMEDVDTHGIKSSVQHVLQQLDPRGEKPIHVSFDIDSLDALEAPSTGTPVRGGLTLREGINMMETIYATGRLRAVDLVEINPAIGTDTDRRHTIDAGLSILKAALGAPRRGTAPKGVLDLPKPTTA